MPWENKFWMLQIPDYAHHNIGVGGMVINDKDEVLVIQERHFVTPHRKLPGGKSTEVNDNQIKGPKLIAF